MIVGINADGTVAGAKVTSHAETPGLGAKSQADPNWITQFAGQTADGQLKVAKDGGTINAITGATITSRASIRRQHMSLLWVKEEKPNEIF